MSATCGLFEFGNGINFVGNESVGFTVDGVGCLRVRCLDQAEDFARLLVNPILQVVDSVGFLRGEICRMSPGNVASRNASFDGMDIQVEWDWWFLSVRDPDVSRFCRH